MFYLYLHFRPDGSLFYIGKGTKKRAWNFTRSRSRGYKHTRDKHGAKNIEVLVFPRDSEKQALEDEKSWIAIAREAGERLVNLADGGIGGKTYSPTPEQRAANGQRQRGRTHSEETKALMRASAVQRNSDPGYLAKLSTSLMGNRRGLGHTVSEEHKAKLSRLKAGIPRDPLVLQKSWETRRRNEAEKNVKAYQEYD